MVGGEGGGVGEGRRKEERGKTMGAHSIVHEYLLPGKFPRISVAEKTTTTTTTDRNNVGD